MEQINTRNHKKTLFIVQFGLLLAIEAIIGFTPLGSLPAIGPIVATLAHVPVIIAAILLGTGAGALMGFFFGLFSLIVWTFMTPNPLVAFAFTPFYSAGNFQGNIWSLVICFVPRILVGVAAGLLFKGFAKLFKGKFWAYSLSGFLASLVNTFLVLGGIYVFFGAQYSQALGLTEGLLLSIIGGTILTSGIPEAVLGGILAYAICRPLRKAFKYDY